MRVFRNIHMKYFEFVLRAQVIGLQFKLFYLETEVKTENLLQNLYQSYETGRSSFGYTIVQ